MARLVRRLSRDGASAVHRWYLLTNSLLSVAFVLIVRRPAPGDEEVPSTPLSGR